MTNKSLSRKKNFTLIELLVVIGIIGILVGILLPAISAALKEGKKTQAEANCRLIAQAVDAYKNDYQELPGNSATPAEMTSGSAILSRLGGQTGRKKVYFENTGSLTNPWDDNYWIAFDDDYDGTISFSGTYDGVSISATVPGSVAVFTVVPGSSATYVGSWGE